MRETLYGEFITACSKLVIDSFERTLDKPETLLPAYELLNRIRLCATRSLRRGSKCCSGSPNNTSRLIFLSKSCARSFGPAAPMLIHSNRSARHAAWNSNRSARVCSSSAKISHLN
jgi:hypothetical protein